jgi:hypothetical protein
MTISSTTREVSFVGNGSAATFAFPFKVFAATDLVLSTYEADTGVTIVLTINTDYSAVLNASQDSFPGGSVTLVAGPLATGLTLTITSGVPNLQPTELTNQGGFYPEVITTALDRATIQIQQLQVQIGSVLANMKVKPCTVSTPFTVYTAPGNVAAAFVNGVLQSASNYSAVGPVITFNYVLSSGDIVDALCTS